MTGELSPWHWLIVIGVLVVLFGAKKLPTAARGLGQSLRIFKAEMAGLRSDSATPPTDGSSRDAPADPSPERSAPSTADTSPSARSGGDGRHGHDGEPPRSS